MAPNAVELMPEAARRASSRCALAWERSSERRAFILRGSRLRPNSLAKADWVTPWDDTPQTSTGYDGKTHIEQGSYLTTWQKQKDGSWKVVSDIGSPDPQ